MKPVAPKEEPSCHWTNRANKKQNKVVVGESNSRPTLGKREREREKIGGWCPAAFVPFSAKDAQNASVKRLASQPRQLPTPKKDLI